MEAANLNNSSNSDSGFEKAVKAFFKENNPDTVRGMFWCIFQCWVQKDCDSKTEVSHQVVARFFDQLTDFIGAAYVAHEMSNPSGKINGEPEND